ncbi:MAG: hypothetical protein ABSE07_09640 [Methanoregula sp.]|jgi:ElaB/YqjD/DUF883 family membrane-anchored ribosome-binding protein
MKIIISGASWEGLNIMAEDTIDRMVNKTVAGADTMKLKTADALEEAARKLRSADMSVHGDEVKHVLHDAEERIHQFKEEAGVKYHEMEAEYHKKVEPVETIISDHPIPAVLVAMGVGFLFGMLICKSHD